MLCLFLLFDWLVGWFGCFISFIFLDYFWDFTESHVMKMLCAVENCPLVCTWDTFTSFFKHTVTNMHCQDCSTYCLSTWLCQSSQNFYNSKEAMSRYMVCKNILAISASVVNLGFCYLGPPILLLLLLISFNILRLPVNLIFFTYQVK